MRAEEIKSTFLAKHLGYFIEYNNYMVLHFSILYWHLDLYTLRSVLKSETIKEQKGNVEKNQDGDKIYLELYNYLRLVKSEEVKSWLIKTYPMYEAKYQNDFFW